MYHTVNPNTPQVKPLGVLDYVNSEGKLIRDAEIKLVLVRTSADLDDLADMYPPGTIATTATGASKWMLDASGTWQTWVG
jgi:hypothetical protein